MNEEFISFFRNATIPDECIELYVSKFIENDIQISDIHLLSESQLEKMGVTKIGHQTRIREQAKRKNLEQNIQATTGASTSSEVKKTKTPALTPTDNFRSQLQRFIDENIEPSKRYEAAKLMSFAVNLFSEHVKDTDYQLKDLKDLEKEVTGRGLIEIMEKRFLDPRSKKDIQKLSHKERFEKILQLQHVEVLVIKKRIDEDDDLTLENFPKYAALAHDYFSAQIHIYLYRKKKIDFHNLMSLDGMFPGRAHAIKAVKILFSSLCSPTKGSHKRLFKPQTNEVLVGLNEQNPYNTHIRFDEEDDEIKPRKLFCSHSV